MARRYSRYNYRYYPEDWNGEAAALEARDQEAAMLNGYGWVTQISQGDGFFALQARRPEDTVAPLDDFGELYRVHPPEQAENGMKVVICTPILSPEEAERRRAEITRVLARIILDHRRTAMAGRTQQSLSGAGNAGGHRDGSVEDRSSSEVPTTTG